MTHFHEWNQKMAQSIAANVNKLTRSDPKIKGNSLALCSIFWGPGRGSLKLKDNKWTSKFNKKTKTRFWSLLLIYLLLFNRMLSLRFVLKGFMTELKCDSNFDSVNAVYFMKTAPCVGHVCYIEINSKLKKSLILYCFLLI